MIVTKVSLTVAVPGAVTFSKQLCFKNSKNGEEVPVENIIVDKDGKVVRVP